MMRNGTLGSRVASSFEEMNRKNQRMVRIPRYFTKALSMKTLEDKIRIFLSERGWDKLRPSDLAKSISIEAAELLEVFQWTSMDIERTKRDAIRMEEIKKELADVFIYSIEMAVLLNLDVREIVNDKLELVREKYPVRFKKRLRTSRTVQLTHGRLTRASSSHSTSGLT